MVPKDIIFNTLKEIESSDDEELKTFNHIKIIEIPDYKEIVIK